MGLIDNVRNLFKGSKDKSQSFNDYMNDYMEE